MRQSSEADRPVAPKVISVALPVDWDTVCQLPVNWDLSTLPEVLKNQGESSRYDISQLFKYHWMNYIRVHRLLGMQLKQQIPCNFWTDWEFIVLATIV